MQVPFSPPDITDAEIEAVSRVLKSGWITTGPETKAFEEEIASFCQTPKAAAFYSATAAMEMALHALGIGPGDEVITSAYTYTASCSVITHVGATPVLADIKPGTYEIDPESVARNITSKTKAIIPVDLGGKMVDYDELFKALEDNKHLFSPAPGIQEAFGRVIVLADAAHSLGASYKDQPSGSVADLSAFSLHAVKNITTAEGGMLTWKEREGLDNLALYNRLMMLSLHGQSKDALAKSKAGSWEYDIIEPAYKCNMTDLSGALGRVQLRRYPDLLKRRREIAARYSASLNQEMFEPIIHQGPEAGSDSSYHLMLVQLKDADVETRNRFIQELAQRGVSANVHYKPLPLLTAYKNLGFEMEDYPHSYDQYQTEVTLPLHTKLTDEQVDYVIASAEEAYIASR